MTSALALNRTLGTVLSGRYIGGIKAEDTGFGFDLAVLNPAERSGAYLNTDNNDQGDDLSYAVRLIYEFGKGNEGQAAYGIIEDAGQNRADPSTSERLWSI